MSAGDFTGSLQVLEKGPNARFFVLGTGRFAQPDTIVPGYANPQNLNRFAYVSNNPLNYIDPSGHDGTKCYSESGQQVQCGVILLDAEWTPEQVISGEAFAGDPGDGAPGGPGDSGNQPGNIDDDADIDIDWSLYPELPTPGQDHSEWKDSFKWCTSFSYVQCFYGGGLLLIESDGYMVNELLFHYMLIAIYFDVDQRDHDINITTYDTPFWNGKTEDGFEPDYTVCFGESCYKRSEVNYVGVAMAAAKWGIPREVFLRYVNYRKNNEYGHGASPGVNYWVNAGYDAFEVFEDISVSLYEGWSVP